ncbi:MAG: prepilin peptidase [bacterium]
MSLIIFIFGLCIGSFLNVCICRFIEDESVIFPASHCPECKKNLRWFDNVPIISFLLLGGKCRYCLGRISLQYPAVEFLTGIIFWYIYVKWGFSRELFMYVFLTSMLLVIGFIDARTTLIPDIITVPGIITGLVLNLVFAFIDKSFLNFFDAFLGMVLGLGVFGFIVFASRGGMGIGDIKLAGLIGVFLGLKNAFLTVLLSFIIGGFIGIILLVFKIKKRRDEIPFGPYLATASVISIFWGETIYRWWLG